MWARYWAHIVLTSALIYVYFNGIGLPFQQMFLLIPPKPTVIRPLSVKIYSKNPKSRSPNSALRSPLYAHILKFPGKNCEKKVEHVKYEARELKFRVAKQF